MCHELNPYFLEISINEIHSEYIRYIESIRRTLEKVKDKGNQKFKEKKYNESVSEYQKGSVLGQFTSNFLKNRSAFLLINRSLKKEFYKLCLILFSNQCQSYICLGKYFKAFQAYYHAETFYDTIMKLTNNDPSIIEELK